MTAIDKLIEDMQELKKTKLYASSFKCIDDCLFLAEYYKKEELKQETLEEATEKYAKCKSSSSVFQKAHKRDFIEGAKCQAERMFSEIEKATSHLGFRRITLEKLNNLPYQPFITDEYGYAWIIDTSEFLEQFKKK